MKPEHKLCTVMLIVTLLFYCAGCQSSDDSADSDTADLVISVTSDDSAFLDVSPGIFKSMEKSGTAVEGDEFVCLDTFGYIYRGTVKEDNTATILRLPKNRALNCKLYDTSGNEVAVLQIIDTGLSSDEKYTVFTLSDNASISITVNVPAKTAVGSYSRSGFYIAPPPVDVDGVYSLTCNTIRRWIDNAEYPDSANVCAEFEAVLGDSLYYHQVSGSLNYGTRIEDAYFVGVWPSKAVYEGCGSTEGLESSVFPVLPNVTNPFTFDPTFETDKSLTEQIIDYGNSGLSASSTTYDQFAAERCNDLATLFPTFTSDELVTTCAADFYRQNLLNQEEYSASHPCTPALNVIWDRGNTNVPPRIEYGSFYNYSGHVAKQRFTVAQVEWGFAMDGSYVLRQYSQNIIPYMVKSTGEQEPTIICNQGSQWDIVLLIPQEGISVGTSLRQTMRFGSWTYSISSINDQAQNRRCEAKVPPMEIIPSGYYADVTVTRVE